MNKTVSFGRRGRIIPDVAAAQGLSGQALAGQGLAGQGLAGQTLAGDIALTPAQRAYLFGADAPAAREDILRAKKPKTRGAGLIACLAVTAVVVALTLLGKPHDTVAALPPQLEDQAKAVFQLAGRWFTPLTLAWSIFIIASNLAANLWLTEKLCGWRRWSGFPAFSLIGAAMSVVVAFATALIGLGDTEIGYGMEALSGGGAAALYRLLAGRRSFQ